MATQTRMRGLYLAMAAGGLIGLSVGFVAATGGSTASAGGSAKAQGVPEVETAVSSASSKGDRLDVTSDARANRAASAQNIASSAVVNHVEIAGPKGSVVTFVDGSGRTVYRSDPLRNETLVVRDARIPSVTVRDTAETTAQIRIVSIGEDEADQPAAPAEAAPAGTSTGPTALAAR